MRHEIWFTCTHIHHTNIYVETYLFLWFITHYFLPLFVCAKTLYKKWKPVANSNFLILITLQPFIIIIIIIIPMFRNRRSTYFLSLAILKPQNQRLKCVLRIKPSIKFLSLYLEVRISSQCLQIFIYSDLSSYSLYR